MERSRWLQLSDARINEIPLHGNHDFAAWSLSVLPAASAPFTSLLLAVAHEGGLFACCFDDSKPLLVDGLETAIPPLCIFNGIGDLLSRIPWDKEHATILALGWTADNRLATVLDDGTVRLYSIRGDYTTFDLGDDARGGAALNPATRTFNAVRECVIAPGCLIARLKSNRFLVVSDWNRPVPRLLPSLGTVDDNLKAWSLATNSLDTHTDSPEIFVFDMSNCYLVSDGHIEKLPSEGEVVSIQVSPNANFWACLLKSRKLQIRIAMSEDSVLSVDIDALGFTQSFSELQIKWCSEDIVMVASTHQLTFIHSSGEHFSRELYDPVHLSSTKGGCFVLSSFEYYLVASVHYSLQQVLQLGSRHPGALLVDCSDQATNAAPQAAEILTSLLAKRDNADATGECTTQLRSAIMACILAAQASWSSEQQRRLLRAAQLGRTWIPFDVEIRDTLVQVINRLRIANLMRNTAYIPVSPSSVATLDDGSAIRLLIVTGAHELAYAIARTTKSSKLFTAQVVSDWARLRSKTLPTSSSSGQAEAIRALTNTIVDRLAGDPDADFSHIARCAFEDGRNEFAVSLLAHETNNQRKIPLLLEMGLHSQALSIAVASKDDYLVSLIIRFLRKILTLSEFCYLFKSIPDSIRYLEEHGRRFDRDLLRDFYFLEDRNEDLASLTLEDAFNEKDDMQERLRLLREAANGFQISKRNMAQLALIRAEETSLKVQLELAANNRDSALQSAQIQPGEPSYESIRKLLNANLYGLATKVKQRLGLSDREFSWLVLRSCILTKNYSSLDELMKKPRSDYIERETIYRELMDAGDLDEAGKYAEQN